MTRNICSHVSTSPVNINGASLVDSSTHSPALMELLDIKLSRHFTEFIVDCVLSTVDIGLGRRSSSPSSSQSSSRGRSLTRNSIRSRHRTFVAEVISSAHISIPVLLVALVYIDRAQRHLHIEHDDWAFERVWLGGVVLASKYLLDSPPKNPYFAVCTGIFGSRDIGLMERELLGVLDFNLGVQEEDLLNLHRELFGVLGVLPSAACHDRWECSSRREAPEDEDFSSESDESSSESDESSSESIESPSERDDEEREDWVVVEPRTPSSSVNSPPLLPFSLESKNFSHGHESILNILRSFPLPLTVPSHAPFPMAL